MNVIISRLIKEGYDIHNKLVAARKANERYSEAAFSHMQWRDEFNTIFGFVPSFQNNAYARVMIRYMVTEAIQLHTEGFIVEEQNLMEAVNVKVKNYFSALPWFDPNNTLVSSINPEANKKVVFESESVPVDEIRLEHRIENGKLKKPPKGEKQAGARRIYEQYRTSKTPQEIKRMFMDQLGMTDMGANTYVFNMRKEFGDSKPRGSKK